jgi:hypothetical protein
VRIVENSPARLILRDRSWWISAVCFAAAAILVGDSIARGADADKLVPAALAILFGFAFLHVTDVGFDRIRRTCDIRRFDVVRLTRRRLRFDEIVDIRIDTSRFPDSDEIGCRLGIVTAATMIPLTAAYEPDPERYAAMREVLLDMLLGDSPHPLPDDPVDALVKEGRLIDAVALLRMRDGSNLTEARARVAELQARVKGKTPGR